MAPAMIDAIKAKDTQVHAACDRLNEAGLVLARPETDRRSGQVVAGYDRFEKWDRGRDFDRWTGHYEQAE